MRSILRMDIRRIFGANLRHYRLAAGLSQEAVAERMGVDRAHVSSMERGSQNVTLITLWHLADALKIQPADLLDTTSKPPVETPRPARRRLRAPVRRRRNT
ncbi:helix-turn-helix domain-containing protein [Acidiphilium multivorum]|uniref:helix-turn-helix domain-containing protein n=1 Tax=Acidiphilium multivorum TaxID=62140 RepID=UPI002016235F|nr:helix-turn-helix transcriptional regulator [Acidiphilium multivorum]